MDHTASPIDIGASVRLVAALPYLKSADPMPMLRPADLVGPDEIGQVVALRAADQVAVRFRRGTFLIARSHLQSL
ncbi:MAG: NAD(P)H dehydrogenase assembly family protein [Prochlorococcaceae cyanobacterium]